MQLKQNFLKILKDASVLLALFVMGFGALMIILWISFIWGDDNELYGWPIDETSCPTPACDQH